MRLVARAFALAALALVAVPTGAAAQGTDVCIRSWGEVRYGALAYNHIVHIANACDPDADCTVTTDVAPEPQRTLVPGHSTVDVVTFLGSPARAFTPHVVCTMRAR